MKIAKFGVYVPLSNTASFIIFRPPGIARNHAEGENRTLPAGGTAGAGEAPWRTAGRRKTWQTN